MPMQEKGPAQVGNLPSMAELGLLACIYMSKSMTLREREGEKACTLSGSKDSTLAD